MEISPILLFRLLLYSFAFGAILGGVNDVSRILRVFCGVRYSEKRFGRWYERELPLIHRPLNRGKQGRFSGALLQVLIFFQDVFLFLTAGVGLVILNYEMNQGRELCSSSVQHLQLFSDFFCVLFVCFTVFL